MATANHRGLRPDEAVILVLLSAIWGASFLFIKVAVEDVSPLFVVAARLTFGAIAVGGWLLARRGWAATRALFTGLPPLEVVALALTASAVPFLLISWAETRIASSLAGMLNAAVPLITALLAFRVDPANRLRGWRSAGLLVGFAGVALVAGGDIEGSGLGVLAMLGAVVLYAVGTHVAKQRFAHVEPIGVALVQVVTSAAIVLPLALAFGRPHQVPGGDTVAALLALGLGGTGLAYALFYWLIASAGPQHAVAVTYLAPVFAIVYGVAVLGEHITALALAGVAVIIAGEVITALPARGSALAQQVEVVPESVP